MLIQAYGDNFIPVVPTNYPIHTDTHPHCSDYDCPCYNALKRELRQSYLDGLVSAKEAMRILEGKQIWQ